MIILIAGNYKTGKTISAYTFPRPIVALDLDNGASSIERATGADGKLIIPDTKDINIFKFTRTQYSTLDFRTVDKESKSIGAPSYSSGSFAQVANINNTLNSVANGSIKCRTLIIDSLSALFLLWKDSVLHMNSIFGLRLQDYRTLDQVLFHQFIPNLKMIDDKVDYIILVCHTVLDKDELTGRIVEYPLGPSQAMGRTMGREFDEIWLQVNEGGKFSWRTKPYGFFQAGSRLNITDPITPATYQQLKHLIPTLK